MKTEVMMPSCLRAGLLPPSRPLVRTHLLQIAALVGGQGADGAQAMGAYVLLLRIDGVTVDTSCPCTAPMLTRPKGGKA